MKVGVIIDSPDRDIDGCVAVCLKLASLGHEAFLIPMYYQGFEIPKLEVDYLLANFCRRANKDLLQNLSNAGVTINVLDQEGAVWESLDQYCRSYPSDSFEYVSCIFTWGETQKTALDKYFNSRLKIINTGHPRIDFLTRTARHDDHDRYKSDILVVGNFGLAFPRHASATQEAKNMMLTGFSQEFAFAKIQEDADTRGELFDLMKTTIKKFPNLRFCIRPHPFEDWEAYCETFSGKFPNVSIEPHEPVARWLFSTKVLLHISSSVAIEAAIARKHVLQLAWLKKPLTGQAGLPNEAGSPLSSHNELENFLTNLTREDADVLSQNRVSINATLNKMSHYYNNIHEPATEKLVRSMMDEIAVGTNKNWSWIKKLNFILKNSRSFNLRYFLEGVSYLILSPLVYTYLRSHILTKSKFKRDKWLTRDKLKESVLYCVNSYITDDFSDIEVSREGPSFKFVSSVKQK